MAQNVGQNGDFDMDQALSPSVFFDFNGNPGSSPNPNNPNT